MLNKNVVLVFLLISTVFFSACTITGNVISIPKEDRPQNMDELESEAELIAMLERTRFDEAKESVLRAYPEFAEKKPGFFAPPAKHVKFLECDDLDGKDFYRFGKVTVTFEYGGSKKKVTFREKCNNKVVIEYYCRDNRYVRLKHECSHGCWDDSYCK